MYYVQITITIPYYSFMLRRRNVDPFDKYKQNLKVQIDAVTDSIDRDDDEDFQISEEENYPTLAKKLVEEEARQRDYQIDVTEERIEGIESAIELLSKAVNELNEKVQF